MTVTRLPEISDVVRNGQRIAEPSQFAKDPGDPFAVAIDGHLY
jgi:hypothetical protein